MHSKPVKFEIKSETLEDLEIQREAKLKNKYEVFVNEETAGKFMVQIGKVISQFQRSNKGVQ